MDYKEKIQPFDVIVVFKPRSWFHRVVKQITEYTAGHVALYVGDGNIIEAQSTGIKKTGLKNYSADDRIRIARPINLTTAQGEKILEYCNAVVGEKYSYGQLILIAAKYIFKLKWIPDADRDAQICSEFIANAYLRAGISVKNKPAHESVPGDFLDSANFIVL